MRGYIFIGPDRATAVVIAPTEQRAIYLMMKKCEELKIFSDKMVLIGRTDPIDMERGSVILTY